MKLTKQKLKEAYKVYAKSKLGIGPKKWELEKFLTGGKSFDYKKPIKVIDKKQTLLGIGFFNNDLSNINPKLVLNAK